MTNVIDFTDPKVKQNKTKSQDEVKKLSRTEILTGLSRCLHPAPLSPNIGPLKSFSLGRDLRLIKSQSGATRWASAENGELVPIDDEVVIGIVGSVLSSLFNDLSTKDYSEIIKLGRVNAAFHDSLSSNEKVLINEEDIATVRTLSEPGWCYKRLSFNADINSAPTIWQSEVFARIKSNLDPFCAWIGSLFDETSDREKYVWMYGSGKSGKSTICDAIISCFGSAGVSRNYEHMSSRWFTGSIERARLCVLAEAAPKLVASGRWKSLTGDRYQEIEEKNKALRTAEIRTKFIISSNDYPQIASGYEHYRRAIIVETERPLGWEQTRTMNETMRLLEQGLPWFIAYCLNAYKQNPQVMADMDIVEDLQGEDEFEVAFKSKFIEDPLGRTTIKEMKSIFPDRESWWVNKFVSHCVRNHRAIRVRSAEFRFVAGIRKTHW